MGVTSKVYSVSTQLLAKLRKDNEMLGSLFGDTEDADASWKVEQLEFVDFEDTHRLLHYAGYSALHEALDFEKGNDDAFEYDGYDIQIATPAKVKKIAAELERVTLDEVRAKGLEGEFKTDRRGELLKPEDYDAQFEEIQRASAFFAAAAKAGNAVVASAI